MQRSGASYARFKRQSSIPLKIRKSRINRIRFQPHLISAVLEMLAAEAAAAAIGQVAETFPAAHDEKVLMGKELSLVYPFW